MLGAGELAVDEDGELFDVEAELLDVEDELLFELEAVEDLVVLCVVVWVVVAFLVVFLSRL